MEKFFALSVSRTGFAKQYDNDLCESDKNKLFALQ